MRRYRFYMISLGVVLFLFSVATIRVNGQGEHNIAAEREFYEELEKTYVANMREMLGSKGYSNAGITMTKIYGTDGSREYTVQIHHKQIEKLSSPEQTVLQNELAQITLGDEQSRILHKFLICEE